MSYRFITKILCTSKRQKILHRQKRQRNKIKMAKCFKTHLSIILI